MKFSSVAKKKKEVLECEEFENLSEIKPVIQDKGFFHGKKYKSFDTSNKIYSIYGQSNSEVAGEGHFASPVGLVQDKDTLKDQAHLDQKNMNDDSSVENMDLRTDLDKHTKTQYLSRGKVFAAVVSVVFILFVNYYEIHDENKSVTAMKTTTSELYDSMNFKGFREKISSSSNSFARPFSESPKGLASPLSTIPPYDITVSSYIRPEWSQPGPVFGSRLSHGAQVSGVPLPTNAWYQNALIGDNLDIKPTEHQRVYTVPYVIDFVGPIPGIRTNCPFSTGGDTIVQWTFNEEHGLTLGMNILPIDDVIGDTRKSRWAYTLESFSHLGFHLRWEQETQKDFMTAPIVRGMPYTTMLYSGDTYPVIASKIPNSLPPLIDGNFRLHCNETGTTAKVTKDVELYFKDSDFTWLVFYSRPVTVYCDKNNDAAFELQILPEEYDEPLVVRAALLNNCTTGINPLYCYRGRASNSSLYADVLRKHAAVYPYKSSLKYDFPKKNNNLKDAPVNAELHFDWDAKHATDPANNEQVIMFALPHHIDLLAKAPQYSGCSVSAPTLHGKACLISSNIWTMEETLPDLGYTAPRPPKSDFIPALAESLHDDMNFELPSYFMRGAGDTYFSGKMLAKLARIVIICDELRNLQNATNINEIEDMYSDSDVKTLEETIYASGNVTLPSDQQFQTTLDRLRSSVEVWVNGTAETVFVYDASWGGVVSCGCYFDSGTLKCGNAFPNCPAFTDPGLNFGNGFYNDHHFHYGYHIYAAAVVAHFDPEWGRTHFEEVLLLIRDIANPSVKDNFFPTFRHKDWYLGNSWANGIPVIGGQPYLNGRNQESSSEAIAAYEGVALFGSAMVDAWTTSDTNPTYKENAIVSAHIRDIGRLLTVTELRAADTYYHVRHDTSSHKIYPPRYSPYAVGMLWSMMAQFQTWFGALPIYAIGIQLLPITPVSEIRDNVTWAKELYHDFANSCEMIDLCVDQGWAVLQYALLAEVGHPDAAMNKTLETPSDVFTSAGGNGHSLSNTLWYISSRPDTIPLPIEINPNQFSDCGCPKTCTKAVKETNANGFSCSSRIQWTINSMGKSENEACAQVAGLEFPEECGGCNPNNCERTPTASPVSTGTETETGTEKNSLVCGCPKTCTKVVLGQYADGYTCNDRIEWLIETMGMGENSACSQVGGNEFPNICGGCDPNRCVNGAMVPTKEKTSVNVTKEEEDGSCKVCSQDICQSDLNRCQPLAAPYLCSSGRNKGGCSPIPWKLSGGSGGLCSECCKITAHCGDK